MERRVQQQHDLDHHDEILTAKHDTTLNSKPSFFVNREKALETF